MTRRGNVNQYGVIAIGQHVAVHQLLRGPGMPVLTSETAIETHHTGTVTDMWVGDSGAQTTVLLDNGYQVTMCVDHYGHQHGGFGAIKVLRQAPTQTSLQGMPA